jgi:ribosome-associated translation inhibitor RaiA
MQIIVNTDNNVEGSEELERITREVVEQRLGRFSEQVTRIEVHLGDENSHKTGDNDKRCMMEARPRGMDALAVTHQAPTLDEAMRQAAKKLERVLDSALQKRDDPKGRAPMR